MNDINISNEGSFTDNLHREVLPNSFYSQLIGRFQNNNFEIHYKKNFRFADEDILLDGNLRKRGCYYPSWSVSV